MTTTALIIIADPMCAAFVQLMLHDINCQADAVPDGAAGLRAAATGRYDLLVLDWELPGEVAAGVCQQLRARHAGLSILAIANPTNESEIIRILEQGADDCLVRPFGLPMLRARTKARLNELTRRQESQFSYQLPTPRPHYYVQGELTLSRAAFRVTARGRVVQLTPKEFDLLAWFMQHPGRVFTREQLLNELWGSTYEGYEYTVNAHINRLRLKIEADPTHPEYILTVWGVGYQFTEPTAEFEPGEPAFIEKIAS